MDVSLRPRTREHGQQSGPKRRRADAPRFARLPGRRAGARRLAFEAAAQDDCHVGYLSPRLRGRRAEIGHRWRKPVVLALSGAAIGGRSHPRQYSHGQRPIEFANVRAGHQAENSRWLGRHEQHKGNVAENRPRRPGAMAAQRLHFCEALRAAADAGRFRCAVADSNLRAANDHHGRHAGVATIER